MLHEIARPARRWRIAMAIGLLVAALLVIALLVVHTPPLRAFALRYASRVVLNLGVRLEAERLDYNLLTRRVGLVGVKVWAVGEDQPFFEAEEVRAVLPARALTGELSVDEVTVRQGAVHILRRADGSTNLPRSTGSSSGDPAPLPIRRVFAPRLTIDYRDEGNAVLVRVPSFTLDLSARGRLAIDVPAEVAFGQTSTTVAVLQGDGAFDGRDLRLSELRFETSEARARLEGTLAIFRREPAMDLHVSGDVDLARASKWWGQSDRPPRGVVRFDGDVRGPFDRPAADLNLTSDRLATGGVEADSVTARVRVDLDAVEVAESQLQLMGGQVAATGGVAWESGRARINASWRGLDAARLVAVLSDAEIVPSGRSSGDIAANGTLDAWEAWDVDARLNLDRGPTLRGRIPAPGEARLRLADRQWRLDATHVVGGAPVDVSLTGRLRGPSLADSTLGGTIGVSQSDVKELLSVLAQSDVASISGDLVSGSFRAQATLEGTVGGPVVRLIAESDAARVAGQDVVNLRARGRLADSFFDLEELLAQQPSTRTDGAPQGQIRISGGYDLRGGTYTGRVSAGSWRFEPTPDLPLSAVVGLEYSGEGRGRLAYGKGQVSTNRAAWEEVDLGELTADVELTGDVAHISARASDFAAAADADIRLAEPYAATVRANAPALDLGRVVRDAKLPTVLTGSASVRLEAEGPLQRWREGRASVDIVSLDARLEELPIRLYETARVRYEAQRLLVDRLEASAGGTRLSASGALAMSADARPGALPGDSLVVTLTGDVGEVNEVARAVVAAAGRRESFIAGGDGPVTVLARISGTAVEPVWAADLEVGPSTVLIRADVPALMDLRVRAHVENGILELRETTGAYQAARFTARGQAPLALFTGSAPGPAAGDAVLQARATGITSEALAPFLDEATRAQVGGSLDATLNLTAPALTLDDVTGELVLERLDLTVADVPIRQRMPTRVVARDGFARIQEWEWEGEGTSLTVEGQVHLSDQQAALLANGVLDARLLTAFVRDSGITTAGRIEPRLSITGPLAEPTINGDIHLASGEVRIREPRIVVGDLDARAVLARGQAYLTALTGTVNGGTLTGSGQLDYAPRLSGRFTAEAIGMAIEFPEGLRSEVDASLELTAADADQSAPAGRLSGTVTVKRGAYREPLALVTGLLANLRRSTTSVGGARSPILDQLALDVRVITDEDLVIQNNVARAQLGADLRVIGLASAPSLSGRAELREGGQLFLGRNTYTVESGTIDFANPVAIEPILGISATTRAGGEDIQIKISGTPDALTTDLSSSSDPDLGQADISSILLTGRRLDELSTDEAALVGAQVLGNLSGDVLGFAGRAVGLDTLRVGGVDTTTVIRDPADLASEVDPTSRLTFGKSLGSTLDVTLSQSLVKSAAQTWIIDYLPVRRIALRLVSNDEDFRSYEFRHDLTFGGGPRPIRSGNVSRDLEPPRVAAIRLQGQPGLPEGQILQQLRLREGDRFDFIAWQEDRDRLERFYHERRHLEARVVPSRRETAEGVELTYELIAGPETDIRISGAQFTPATLESMETAWSQSVFDGFLVEEVEGIVRRELARDGVYQASVTVTLVDGASTRTLDVTVVPGTRAERIDIRLDGVPDSLRSDLAETVGDRASGQLAIASPEEYERRLIGELQARGYLQASATVGAPVSEGATVSIPVAISTGPQFLVGGVTFEGLSGLPLDDLRTEAALEEGADYRPAAVDEARDRLQSRYRREGYTSAAVEPRQQIRSADAAVDLTFVVKEGPRQVVSEVTVTGLRSVAEDVVTRALRLNVGDPLRSSDWLDARRRLFETGLFRRVDVALEPSGEPAATTPVRLRVIVEEWPALRVRYGFQVSEERPEEDVNGRDLVPGVSVDATRRTLFGRAIAVGAAAQYQARERLGRLFMNTPTLFSWPVQSSLVLERSRQEQRALTLVTDRTSASWEQRGRRGPLSMSYGLRFERNHTFDTASSGDPNSIPFDITVNIARLTSSGTWDTRDDAADSARGTFASSSLEHAMGALGSDLLFVRSLTQVYHFQPWRDLVLASAARFGIVQPLGGQELIPSERFFAGGARTVRGVSEDGLGERDFFGPIGGEAMLVFNQEVRFPVYRWIRGVAFVDAGNVFAQPQDIGFGSLVGSGGFGLRLVMPFALLRVDYGKTLWNSPLAGGGRWVFGLGQSF